MNGLFQLALCCKIGFGGSADERQTISLLSRCKKSEDDLIEVLNKLKSPEANSKAFPGAIYTTLENVGDISTQDLVSQYRTCGILQDAKDEVKRDLEDLGRSLGTRNAFWTASATLLAGIYSETEQPDEAGVLYFKVMHAIIEMFGEEHELALIATTNVATSLFARGALHDAEEMEVRILEVKRNRLLQRRVHNVLNSQANGTSVYESDDVTIEASSLVQIGTEAQNKLSSLSDRITEALEQRHMDQADALQLETLETLQEVAGADHPTTFSVLHSLIDKYIGRGQWNEVERLQKKEIELSKSKFGHEHSRTLGCLSNLSLTFAQQERWEEARHLQEHTLNTSRTKLGPFHHVTLALMSNLLATFQKLGQDTDAAMIRRQLEDHYRKESSNNLIDSGIADSMANLAVTYRAQGRLQEAEEFQLQVLKERERRLGFEHPNTQRTLAELSLIRENRGKSKKTKD
jgi:tetratricopeptide (TPR) repeat protein